MTAGLERMRRIGRQLVLLARMRNGDPLNLVGLGGSHFILTLDQAARIGTRRDVTKRDVLRQAPKEWNPVSDEHGDTSNHETINQPCPKESLNRDTAVHVQVVGAASSEARHDLCRVATHLLHPASASRGR